MHFLPPGSDYNRAGILPYRYPVIFAFEAELT